MAGDPEDIVFTPTPVASSNLLGRIDKIDRMLQRVGTTVQALPAIQSEVEGAHRQLVALDTKVGYVQDRLARAEDKIDQGHQCVHDSDIKELKSGHNLTISRVEAEERQGVKTLQIVQTNVEETGKLEQEIKDLDKVRRDWSKVIISACLTFIPVVGGGLWFFSRLAGQVEHNEVERKEQVTRIEKRLNGLPTKAEQQQLSQEVQQLRTVLERQPPARYDDVSTLCTAMPVSQRRALRRQLRQLRLSIPATCREE
jgi:hypothetical protein